MNDSLDLGLKEKVAIIAGAGAKETALEMVELPLFY